MLENHLTYYRAHNISPVRQDISDLNAHFNRRSGLYRQLGILPEFVRGKKVIEVGPGSGFNSLYTASLRPSQLVLLEGNPAGAQDVSALFTRFSEFQTCMHLVESDLFDFTSEGNFEFVFCEGLLAGTPEPERMLQRLSSLVAPGGLLVVTSEDYMSKFAETVRRLFADLLSDPTDPLDVRLTVLLPVFSPHLSTLEGMSRRHDDWVIDNLINPASVGRLFSMADTISFLSPTCDFYAASPHFVSDWRWYKLLRESDNHYNALAISQFWENVHSFLDHRFVYPVRLGAHNRKLYEACREIRELTGEFEQARTGNVIERVGELLRQLSEETTGISQELSAAIAEANSFLNKNLVDADGLAASMKFGRLFGRGQQYLCFQRRVCNAIENDPHP